jgi:hypothetical protein
VAGSANVRGDAVDDVGAYIPLSATVANGVDQTESLEQLQVTN